MRRALRLAALGLYSTTPNPRVGCVLVREGSIVGEGWHQRAGEPHAEVLALRAAGAEARGATAYVSLEPCCHTGRTAPCTEALITAGVVRVVCAVRDPNPRVAGQGITRLRVAGVEVIEGLREDEARELNLGFFSRMQRGRPWLRAKMAASLDGRIAAPDGSSQWITGPEARRDGHHWRARACAILTAGGTVRADDPRLNVREVETGRQPLRIVVDAHAQVPVGAKIFEAPGALLVHAGHVPEGLPETVQTLALPDRRGKVDLGALLTELGRREINELHVEAGAGLTGALIDEGLVDELLLYFAPCLLGDGGRGMFTLPSIEGLA
ncbi:MAG: bifunctional diaminohydroxyphosphoribosylaminopyrimidine deaminase/5-amino-6-(5-phosphoribosylamino)uracil reductase RibD, partial [Burkholderiales bacterium]